MRIGSNEKVEAHVPHLGLCNFAGDNKPNHKVPKKVENSTNCQDKPRWCDLIDQACMNAYVTSQVLEEA